MTAPGFTSRHVAIQGQGPSGTLCYSEAGQTLQAWWELGGGNAVAIVRCGAMAEWARHPWALGRRADILHHIADEVVRQKAPGCRAEINLDTGDIVLRQATARTGAAVPDRQVQARHWVFKLSSYYLRVALVLAVAAVLVGAALWIRGTVFSIQPGKGTPLGASLRTDRHLATLIQTREAYVPSLHRDGSKDRFRVSLFLVPLDGAAPRLIPLREGLAASALGTGKLLGSDGQTLWFSVAGIGGIDLASHRLRSPAELAGIDPRQLPQPWGGAPLAPAAQQFLAPGLMTSATTWLGLLAEAEAVRELRPRALFLPVANAVNARQPRRLRLAQVETDAGTGARRLVSVRTLTDADYVNAAFLRSSRAAAPIRLARPDSTLMLFSASPGLHASTVVARVDDDGRLLWRADTGIERFTLRQILPGETATAFVGTRPAVPDQVSEPLLVIVEHDSGRLLTHSLWQ